jgi:hypothetical protein
MKIRKLLGLAGTKKVDTAKIIKHNKVKCMVVLKSFLQEALKKLGTISTSTTEDFVRRKDPIPTSNAEKIAKILARKK